jgi:[CysO sulfur-carrier protein]-S-L-cysteine hydrolase
MWGCIKVISIPPSIYDGLIAHARKGFPLEVCGILGGAEDVVTVAFPMTNTDASNEHFAMDPKEQFAVVKELRAKQLSMQVIYHSHPATPARPSPEDIKLALTPQVSHIIISLADPDHPDVRSFKIENGEVTAEAINIVESTQPCGAH